MSQPSCRVPQYKACSTQICRWLFFIGAIFSEILADRLVSRDSVFLNFHRRYNVSEVTVHHNDGYLPSVPISDFSLPEVIDNRARNVAITATDKIRNYPDYHLPKRDFLRALTRKGTQDTRYSGSGDSQASQHHRRPAFPQNKHSRQTTTQPPSPPVLSDTPPSSFANRISVEEMSCQNAEDELFFRASIKTPTRWTSPMIENVMDEACRATVIGDSYRINFEGNQVWDCGIVDCSTDGNQSYCLDLRFPMISGLRLRDDYRVTLRCKTQDRIAYHTKQISVKTSETKARNLPSVLNGGSKNALDVDVGLFRRTYGSENIFDTRIRSGGTVVLGEEILLRVLINGVDGWRYSKIGEVTFQYVEKRMEQRIVNSLWILDKDGCLNSDVREICPREQYMASPLESYLILQAFMFDGMKETDEIFLTVKATACLEPVDCVVDCPAGHIRHARSIPDRNDTVEWQDDIILRVILPKYESRVAKNYYLTLLLSAVALLTVLITLLWVVKTSFRQRIAKF